MFKWSCLVFRVKFYQSSRISFSRGSFSSLSTGLTGLLRKLITRLSVGLTRGANCFKQYNHDKKLSLLTLLLLIFHLKLSKYVFK